MQGLQVPHSFNPASSVPFIFGALDAEAVPGPILIDLLVDAGHSRAASRALLARLKSSGSLESHRIGRVAAYHLAGAMRTGFDRVDRGPHGDPWDGRFHTVVFDIPESERPVKDHLRYLAQNLGLGILRPGVLITTDRQRLEEGVSAVQTGGLLVTGTLGFDPATSREVASLAWDLPGRSAQLQTEAERVAALCTPEAVPSSPAAAFATFHEHYLRSISLRLSDPCLPPELLPPDWAAGELDSYLHSMMGIWNSAVGRHLDAVVQASPHALLLLPRGAGSQ